MALSDSQYYLFSFLLSLISTLLIRSIFQKPTKPHLHLPPTPPSLPLLGHLHHLSPLIHKSLQKLSTNYGPLLHLRIGFRRCILVSSPEIVAQVFKTQDVAFSARPPAPLQDRPFFGSVGIVGAPYGDYWRFLKKISMTELLSTGQIEKSKTVRHEEMIRFLRKMIESARRGEIVDLGASLMNLTNNIICRMVASTRCSEEDDEAERIREMVMKAIEVVSKTILTYFSGPFKKLGSWYFSGMIDDIIQRYDQLLEKLLQEHEESAKMGGSEGEYRDMMDIVLEINQDEKAGFKLTRSQIKALIMDLFITGTDTSAEMMQWAIAELINNPSKFHKLRKEIESVVGKNKLIQESDIPSLPYLQATVKETLRLHPIAPFIVRECLEHSKIQGFDVPKDSLVFVNAYAIMRDPELWESPNDFCPERFLVANQKQDFSYIPFGGGRRGCPGMNLAYTSINAAIATLVQCFDFEVESRKVNMDEAIGMFLVMASPLKCLPVINFNPFSA